MDVARKSQPAISVPPTDAEPPKLTIEKFADGGITCLRFSGIIDESFDGKKLARSVDGETLVLDLGGVRKISSFGIREWVDFISAACKVAKQTVFIECAPKVVDQLNMVANFAGAGRVISFYAPFRCDYCDSEHRVLFDVGRDFDAIRTMKVADRSCPSCKDAMYFDDDSATYFSYVLGQGPYELDASVVAFLAAKLDYRVGTVDDKLRVDKLIEGRLTYVRLAGDLNHAFPRDKLADGLEGTVVVDVTGVPRVDPAGAALWRAFVQQVGPLVEQLYLIGVAPPLLEKLCSADDLGAKACVVDCMLPYACATCGTTRMHLVDVEEHHAQLEVATAPELRCPVCKAAMQAAADEATMTVLPALPLPTVSKPLARSIAVLRSRAIDKRQGTGIGPLPRAGTTLLARSRTVPVLVGLVAAALLAVGAAYYVHATAATDPGPFGLGPAAQQSAGDRPSWVEPGLPLGDAQCREVSGGVTCVGVSSPSPSLQDAEDEASDTALEAIALALQGRVERVTHTPLDPSAREVKVAALRRDPASSQARRDVREGRRAVARALRGMPPLAGRFWQAFDARDGKRYVAFAQVVLASANVRTVVDAYAQAAAALGATVVTAPPELAWRFAKVDRGALVTALDHGVLQELGLAEHYVVLAIDGRDVVDARGFARVAQDEHAALLARGGALRVLVQADDGDPREFQTMIAGPHEDAPIPTPRGTTTQAPPAGGVNVWDRFGGNR
jgi:ABC-type transporter Mla MlaB component